MGVVALHKPNNPYLKKKIKKLLAFFFVACSALAGLAKAQQDI